jgi:hypothetical protein
LVAGEERRKRGALAKTASAVTRVSDAERELEVSVARALHWSSTWAEVAAARGVTPQAAHKRFRRVRCDLSSGRAWQESPLPL